MVSPPQQPEQQRVLLVRLPDWTIRALQADGPLIVVAKGRVVACCAEAAAEGVVADLRVRDAQLRCPEATIMEHDPLLESEAFATVLDIIEEIVPEVHVVRPGVAAVRARGPARFYGSELAAARALWTTLDLRGYPSTVAVADGLFAAEQAAASAQPISIVSAGGSPDFLAGLDVGVLGEPGLVRTLRQLGLAWLGQFAALDARQVASRFGERGRIAHLRARGIDTSPLEPRRTARQHGVGVSFDEPLSIAEHVIESVRAVVERLIADLASSGLVCTEVRIMVRAESGVRERTWRHAWQFSSRDLLARLAWQLDELSAEVVDGVLAVQFIPTARPAAEHAAGLFGDLPDDHLVHVLSRLQDSSGPHAVLIPALSGSRLLTQRCVLTPFGSAPPTQRRLDQPWPGRLVGPSPSVVLARPQHAVVQLDDHAHPAWLVTEGRRQRVVAWAGPWPVHQRWWGEQATAFDRFQLVTDDQQAWLLASSGGQWWVEARYD